MISNFDSSFVLIPGCVWKEREENKFRVCIQIISITIRLRIYIHTSMAYPLSSIAKNDRMFVVDDDDNKSTFPRLISNDSGISFGESDNDSILSEEYEFDIVSFNEQQQPITITNDGRRYDRERVFKYLLIFL
jgi:hypothetical protein